MTIMYSLMSHHGVEYVYEYKYEYKEEVKTVVIQVKNECIDYLILYYIVVVKVSPHAAPG